MQKLEQIISKIEGLSRNVQVGQPSELELKMRDLVQRVERLSNPDQNPLKRLEMLVERIERVADGRNGANQLEKRLEDTVVRLENM